MIGSTLVWITAAIFDWPTEEQKQVNYFLQQFIKKDNCHFPLQHYMCCKNAVIQL